ncbi:proline dehydrogenase [Nakamurella silvestris]|nr:proline dehydrogenase [Nakamurella silvestris]
MLRKPILALSSSTAVRDVLTKAPLTRSVVNRFIPGSTRSDAIACVADMHGKGLQVTLDHLGEDTLDEADATATVDAYLDLLSELDRRNLAEGAEVSVKLSAVGQALPNKGHAIALDNAKLIATAAYTVGARLNLDMEDHTTVDSTLEILRDLRVDFPDTAIAIQAMLHRTDADLADLVHEGSRVRLVKGAYNEPATVAYQGPEAVDLAYVRAMKILMNGKGYPMIGSHDPRMIEIAGHLAKQAGRDKDSYEYQMLFGIRTDEQIRLAKAGNTVRVYLPYGADWYGYFTRRLAERPANLLFFARAVVGR